MNWHKVSIVMDLIWSAFLAATPPMIVWVFTPMFPLWMAFIGIPILAMSVWVAVIEWKE